jgi:O-antigen/teichoic acid export membrane protein
VVTGEPQATEELGHTTGTAVVRGGIWTAASRIVPQLNIIAISIAAGRFLGPTDMGRQSYIAFVSASVVLVATASLPAAMSRFVAEALGAGRRGVARTLLRMTWRVETAVAIVAVAALEAYAWLAGDPAGAWALTAIACGFGVLHTVPNALLSAAQRWRDATIVGLLTGVVSVPATIAVLAAGGGITGFFAVEAVITAVNFIWTAKLARRLLPSLSAPGPLPPDLRSEFLRFAGVSTLFVAIEFVVWRRSEFFFLQRFSAEAEIAFYSIAFAAATGLTRVPEALAQVTMPAVASLAGEGAPDRIRTGYWRALRLLVFATPAVAAAALAFGPELIRLAYGGEFARAGDVLLVVLAPLPLLPILTISTALMFGLGKLRVVLIAGLAATAVDLVLAALLVPRYDAIGAAVSNVCAQLTAGVPVLMAVSRRLSPSDLPLGLLMRSLLVSVLSGAAAAALVLALGGIPGVLAGAVVAGALFWTLGTRIGIVSERDAQWLRDAGGGRLGQRVGAFTARFATRD